MTKLGLLNIYAQLEGGCPSNQLNCLSNGDSRSILNSQDQVKTVIA